MRRSIQWLPGAVLWFLLPGLSAAAEPAKLSAYLLHRGDELKVIVFGHEDVSGRFAVGEDGSITLPLLGQVAAAGKTVALLEREIAAALDKDYLVDPQVAIEVLTYRPVYILGQVEQPGSYPYETGLDVRKAVALAGGFTSRANRAEMKLIRRLGGEVREVAAGPVTEVLPGDTIEIDRRWF